MKIRRALTAFFAAVGLLVVGLVITPPANAATINPFSCYSSFSAGWLRAQPTAHIPTSAGWCLYNNATNQTLRFQTDGNLVLYTGSQAVWQSGTSGVSSRYLALQNSDGNVVVYNANGTPAWAAMKAGYTCGYGNVYINTLCPVFTAFELDVQTDGNFVLYGDQTQTANNLAAIFSRIALVPIYIR